MITMLIWPMRRHRGWFAAFCRCRGVSAVRLSSLRRRVSRPATPPPELRYINPLRAFAACVARWNSGDGKIPNTIVATANATATNTTSG